MIKSELFIVVILINLGTFLCAFTTCSEDSQSEDYIKGVRITNCPTVSEECTLKKNTNVSLEIDFVARSNSSEIKVVVNGRIIWYLPPIPYFLDNPDGCKDSGITCPIIKGEKYKYTTSLPVKQKYPCISGLGKWQLLDENNDLLVCINIQARIVE